jgi:hypothetical protein
MTVHLGSLLRATKTRLTADLSGSTGTTDRNEARQRGAYTIAPSIPRHRQSISRRPSPAGRNATAAARSSSTPASSRPQSSPTLVRGKPRGWFDPDEGDYNLSASETRPGIVIEFLADPHRKVALHVASGVVPIVG